MKLDDFPTPSNVIEQCISKIVRPTYSVVLEPAAGDGRICKRLKDNKPNAIIHGVEIQDRHKETLEKACDLVTIGSYLELGGMGKYDLIITNPPYSIAEEYVHKALGQLESYGQLVLLLRLGFLESIGRWERLWAIAGMRPTSVYVLCRRPSFTGQGTDATAYAWFVWDKLYTRVEAPLVSWLPPC